ncbi:MAG: triacylglycerol lipase [Deltaproteobacteria bacterium HGW-Deltaproteobacteria-14]|nr:MAG: triacylglycerol lipase [Deltaproteobacteria bacterium HGW-Deltaproteobacteria-14]
MTVRQAVLLVPGFFGFANLGTMAYFGHVEGALRTALADLGIDATISTVKTHPTGSLEARARRLEEALAEAVAAHGDGTAVHIVGHSSGGLDARVLLGGPSGASDPELARLTARVRTVVTVATPHRGTPLATWFDKNHGTHLLRLFSVAALHVTRVGPLPLRLARALAALLGAGYDAAARSADVTDQLIEELLADFSPERARAIRAFLGEVEQDQALLRQLTPTALAALGPTLIPPAGVRIGSVITRARRPWLGAMADLGFDASSQALHLVFRWLQARTAAVTTEPQRPPAPDWVAALARGYGDLPGAQANDGVVPTRSQLWGAPIDVVWADHLDVLGHFGAPGERPPHFDWLPSGSRYRSAAFRDTWRSVAAFIADGISPHPVAPGRS